MKEKIFAYIFVVVLFGMSVINLCLPKQDFSERENRYLQSFPKLNADFMNKFGKYATDRFFLRPAWVTVKADCEFLLNKRENNGVYFCSGGYLIEKFEKNKDLELFNKNLDYIKKFKETQDIPVCFYTLPAPSQVLTFRLPPFADVPEHNPSIIYDALLSHSDEYIYYRTDHHWNTLGAFYAYEKIIEDMGFAPYTKSDFNTKTVSEDFCGTTCSKGNIPVKPDSIEIWTLKEPFEHKVTIDGTEYESLYFMDRLDKKDKYPVFLDGNHACEIINSNTGSGKKLLLIKDSFAHIMAPFLANHFDEIHMIDLRYFNVSLSQYISENGFTDILVLMSEKQLAQDNNMVKLGH